MCNIHACVMFVCMYVMYVNAGAGVPQCLCRGWRTTLRLSPSTLLRQAPLLPHCELSLGIPCLASHLTIGVLGLQIWILGSKLGSSGLHSKCFYLLSPLAGVFSRISFRERDRLSGQNNNVKEMGTKHTVASEASVDAMGRCHQETPFSYGGVALSTCGSLTSFHHTWTHS